MQFNPFDQYEESNTSGLKVRHRRCSFWLCPECHSKMAEARRKRITQGFDGLSHVIMLTLTINPSLFAQPGEAYDFVVREKKLSRLVSYLAKHGQLKDQRYFAVMELQGNGWPHFHVLLNARFIDMEVVEKLLISWVPKQRKPDGDKLGHFSLNEHGIHKAAGYLSKAPDHPAPDWILSRGGDAGRVQFTFTSRGFSKVVDTCSKPSRRQGPPRKKRVSRGPAAGRTYRERHGLCRREVSLFTTMTVSLDQDRQVTKERFAATIELTDQQASLLAAWTEWTDTGYRVDEHSLVGLIEALESQSEETVRVQRVGKGFEGILALTST